MKIKTCAAKIKAAGVHEGTDEGMFDAIVATYDLDSVGDRIIPGAFKETLDEWATSGDPIPVYWSHRMDDPAMNIGQVVEAAETDKGLAVKAQLDLDNPTAAQVYRLLKGRRVTQFSFAYDIEDGAFVEEKGESPYYELRKLRLYEVGPTPIGANQATELLEVKGSGGQSLTVEVHNGTRDDTKAIADTLRGALGAKATGDGPAEDTGEGDEADDDPNKLIAAVDAALDEAVSLVSDVDTTTLPQEVQQALDLVNGAEGLIDQAMDLLGIPDPDDEATEAGKGGTAASKNTERPSAKEGRRNSSTDADTIQSIHDAASALGAACPAKDEGKAKPDLSATTEEPDGAKADEPAAKGTASNRLRTELDLMEAEVSLYT